MESEKERSEEELGVDVVVVEMKGWLNMVMGNLALRIGFWFWLWWLGFSRNLRESFMSCGAVSVCVSKE